MRLYQGVLAERGIESFQDSAKIDKGKCITCCACIENCPQQARSIKQSPVQEAVGRLNSLYAEPKQPETFL